MKVFAGAVVAATVLAAAAMADGDRNLEKMFADGKPHTITVEVKYGVPIVLDSIVAVQKIYGHIKFFPSSLDRQPVTMIEENIVGVRE